jgi:hypothetical protein
MKIKNDIIHWEKGDKVAFDENCTGKITRLFKDGDSNIAHIQLDGGLYNVLGLPATIVGVIFVDGYGMGHISTLTGFYRILYVK